MGLCLQCFSIQSYAQFESGKVAEVLRVLRDLDEFSYNYKINIQFPDGQKDSIIGETFSSRQKGIVYSSSGLNTVLYNGDWYMNADHILKKVVVYPMNKRFNTGIADSIKTSIFQFSYYKEWMDSLVLKYGTVNGALVSKDRISYTITFQPNIPIRKIAVVFNLKKNMPERIEVEAVVEEDEDGKTISRMVCTDYKTHIEERKISMDTYCQTGDKQRIKLTKFKNYKLITLNQ